MSKRKRRSPQELQKASDYFYYEVQMLSYCCETIQHTIANDNNILNNKLQRNVYLESLLIHARSIFSVLYPDEKQLRDDDVIADDYFYDSDLWQQNKHTLSMNIESFHIRVNKMLAHLSYERQEKLEQDREWKYKMIATEIMTAANKFQDMVSDEYIGERGRIRNLIIPPPNLFEINT